MQLLSSLYQPVNQWKKNNFIKCLYHAHTHNIKVNTHYAGTHARTHARTDGDKIFNCTSIC